MTKLCNLEVPDLQHMMACTWKQTTYEKLKDKHTEH